MKFSMIYALIAEKKLKKKLRIIYMIFYLKYAPIAKQIHIE